MIGKSIHELAVGDSAERICRLNATLVAGFVALTGDHNPLHRDADFAASTSFGKPIAPGMLTAALVAAVIGNELPGPGAVYLSQTLKFLRPVCLDDTIITRIKVAEVLHDRNRVCLHTQCVNGAGERVLVGEAWVMPPKGASVQPGRLADVLPMAQAA